MYDFDLFTIGAGSGGVRASRMSASLGARVMVAEAGPFGGTCVNLGCIPKKLFSYAAHFHEDFHDSAGYGWTLPQSKFDWPTLRDNKDREIQRLNAVYESILAKAGAQVVRGRATVLDAHTVQVDDKRYSAANILVATGSRAQVPSIPGAEHGITSDDAFHLKSLPASVVVFGGGYIAVEFASIFNGLGVDTTLVCRRERLLRNFDTDIGMALAEELRKKGVRVILQTNVTGVERSGNSRKVLLAGPDPQLTSLETDCVMFATGRVPLSQNMGLERAGVAMGDNGEILVDDQFRTNLPSILAIGDVIGRIQLTPVALAEAMVVADNLFGKKTRRMNYQNIATAVFSHPNIGTVGMTEEGAQAAGHRLSIFRSNFKALKHTLSGNEERTLMKIIVDADTDRVLGMHMMGADAGEIIQGFAVALHFGATKAQLDATIGIHPTMAEEFVTMREPVG